MADRPVLIAYDGSSASAGAITVAASLLGARPACIVNVWGSVLIGAPVAGGVPAYLSDLEPKLEEKARETAEQGAQLARDAGFDAEARTARGSPAWLAIVEMAETVDAEAIVIGARGLSGLKSVLLGSTSNAVLHHTKRPVLVAQHVVIPASSGD